MKVGDKVRFLSEVGGGIVAGFQDKKTVLVEDEDGFQIPTLIKDCVVVESNDYDSSKVHTDAVPGMERQIVKNKQQAQKDEEDDDPSSREVTFVAPPEERAGGDKLSAYLAFVPMDIKELTKTRFEAYFVNDSNYYMRFSYFTADGSSWHLRATEEVEPNTKLFIEEFGLDSLDSLERVSMQILSYKRKKDFMRKPAIDISFRVDTKKFYKLHTFQENDFFDTSALIYTLVENDMPLHQVELDAKVMTQQLLAKKHLDERQAPKPARVPRKGDEDVVVVDLHASELLDTTAGMSSSDILSYQLDVFRKTLDKYRNKKGQRVIFIHGKGEGVLRSALVNELHYRYKQFTYQDASFQEYGYGATQVTIK